SQCRLEHSVDAMKSRAGDTPARKVITTCPSAFGLEGRDRWVTTVSGGQDHATASQDFHTTLILAHRTGSSGSHRVRTDCQLLAIGGVGGRRGYIGRCEYSPLSFRT